MFARTIAVLLVALPVSALAETPAEKAKALLAAKDCDQLLLSFENAKPKGDAGDLALAKLLAEAASGPCASDKIVAMALSTTAARLAPGDVEVLMAAASASQRAGMNGEAEATYQKAVAAAPKDPRPRLALAELCLGEHDAAGAMKALEAIKANPKAQPLYAQAQKESKESSEQAEQLRKGEARALDAAAKAMASDSKHGSGGASTGVAHEPTGGPGSGKVVFVTGGMATERRTSRKANLKAGKSYRLQASGSCYDQRRRDQLSGSDHGSVTGADVRVKIGSFEHGLALENGRSEDFDFQADSNNPNVEVWNASFKAGEVNCHVSSLTITEL